MPNDLHAFGARLNAAAVALGGQPMKQVMGRLGIAAQHDIEAAARADTGGSLRLRNVKGANRLGSTVKAIGANEITVSATPGGPWALLNTGARAHTIRARPGRFLRTPFGPRRSISIPRTRGRHTWDDAVDDVTARTTERAQDEISDMLREVIL